jgi:uncharacterized protein YggE
MHAAVKVLALIVLCCPVLVARAAERKVIVHGSATVQVKADAALLTFAVTSSSDTGKNAREENDKQVKRLRDALTALGLKNVEVKVVPSAVSTIAADDGPRRPALPIAPTSKQAQSIFHVTVREKDGDKLQEVVTKIADAAAEHGGMAPGGMDDGFSPRLVRRLGLSSGPKIDWLAENVSEARKQAIKKAITEARANAQAAVGDAPLEVVEIRILTDPYTARSRAAAAAEPSTPDSSIPVRVEVEVTYSY